MLLVAVSLTPCHWTVLLLSGFLDDSSGFLVSLMHTTHVYSVTFHLPQTTVQPG